MASNLGDPDLAAGTPIPAGYDDEVDALNAFHVYVPTPGDPTVSGDAPPMGDGSKGTILQMGGTTSPDSGIGTTSFTGFGARTHGHIFLDARGTEDTNRLGASSRITIQSVGRILLQPIKQSVQIAAGRYLVSASNGDQYVTANGGLTLAAGWVGPDPQPEPEPRVDSDFPTASVKQNYLDWMQGITRFWNLVDGVAGTLFTYKYAADALADVDDNDPPDGVGDRADQIVQGASSAQGAIGAAKSLHDSVMGGGVPAPDGPNDDSLPSGTQALADGFPPSGEGVNILGEGGVIIGSPASVNVYAGAGMSLGSTNTTLWGVDTEVYGAASTVVNSASDLKLKAGGDTKLAARLARKIVPAAAAPIADDLTSRVHAIDGELPDAPGDMSQSTAAIDAGGESAQQEQTEDIFLKASKHVRLKSYQDVSIAAPKQVTIRVGPMLVQVTATSASEGQVVIGKGDVLGTVTGAAITVDHSSSSPTIRLKVSDQTYIELNGENDSIALVGSGKTVTIGSSGFDASMCQPVDMNAFQIR